jgi:cell division protein FtsB
MSSTVRRAFAVAALSLGLLAMGYRALGPKGYLLFQQREQEKQSLEHQFHELTLEHLRLSQEEDQLKNNPKAMERMAREQLRLVKPGEVVYMLPAPAPATRTPAR